MAQVWLSMTPEQVVAHSRKTSADPSGAPRAAEMTKWRTVTAVVVPGCLILSVYFVANAEHHSAEKIVRDPPFVTHARAAGPLVAAALHRARLKP
jgi:hypothetical protein